MATAAAAAHVRAVPGLRTARCHSAWREPSPMQGWQARRGQNGPAGAMLLPQADEAVHHRPASTLARAPMPALPAAQAPCPAAVAARTLPRPPAGVPLAAGCLVRAQDVQQPMQCDIAAGVPCRGHSTRRRPREHAAASAEEAPLAPQLPTTAACMARALQRPRGWLSVRLAVLLGRRPRQPAAYQLTLPGPLPREEGVLVVPTHGAG